jgi:flagellar motility protein MotE (MotC chaperone)
LHQYEQAILNEYDNTSRVWSDYDYTYIGCYLGDEYAEDLRQAERTRQEQEREYYERQLQEALNFRRNELLEKLKDTRQDFLLGLSVEAAEMSQLLEISRAFVYSYFDNAVDEEDCDLI